MCRTNIAYCWVLEIIKHTITSEVSSITIKIQIQIEKHINDKVKLKKAQESKARQFILNILNIRQQIQFVTYMEEPS